MYGCYICGSQLVGISVSIWETLIGNGGWPLGHDHNDNCLVRAVKCSEGHVFRIAMKRKCPIGDCDFVFKTTCFCHKTLYGMPEHMKLNEWPIGLEVMADL